MHDFSDPVREGSTATLVCETVGGHPLPRISWWRGKALLDDVVEEVDAKTRRVRNTLRLPNVGRREHGHRLTCRASNTNLTRPVETSIKINMVCKYPTKRQIIRITTALPGCWSVGWSVIKL